MDESEFITLLIKKVASPGVNNWLLPGSPNAGQITPFRKTVDALSSLKG